MSEPRGASGGDYVRLSRPGPVFRNRQSANITAPRTVSPHVALQIKWKLKFPLCQTCAENENPSPCRCSGKDRTMTGTKCTPELQTAVCLGYRVLKIYEVYHWKDTTRYDPETISIRSSSTSKRRVALRTGSRPKMTSKSISIGISKRVGCP